MNNNNELERVLKKIEEDERLNKENFEKLKNEEKIKKKYSTMTTLKLVIDVICSFIFYILYTLIPENGRIDLMPTPGFDHKYERNVLKIYDMWLPIFKVIEIVLIVLNICICIYFFKKNREYTCKIRWILIVLSILEVALYIFVSINIPKLEITC